MGHPMLVIYARSADGHDQFWTCDGYELRGDDLHVFWQGRLTDVITAAQMPSGATVFDCEEPEDCDDIEDATDEPEDLSVFAGPRH
jgi:hypothetical protein